MARSNYIYIVAKSNNKPIAAFTVKHECITWLENSKLKSIDKILRLRDNGRDPDLQEFTLDKFKE